MERTRDRGLNTLVHKRDDRKQRRCGWISAIRCGSKALFDGCAAER